MTYEDRLYEAGPNALFDVVTETKSGVHALLHAVHRCGEVHLHRADVHALALVGSGDERVDGLGAQDPVHL